jgi:hypothetical protein
MLASNWFTHTVESETVLYDVVTKAGISRELLKSAVKSLCMTCSLTVESAHGLQSAGLGVADLREVFDRLEAEADTRPGPVRLIVKAMAYVLHQAPGLSFLIASEELDLAVGVAMVRVMANELFPQSGQTPDPQAHLRWAATELITFRQLEPATLEALSPADRALLAQRIRTKLELLRTIVPPRNAEALELVLAVATDLLDRNPPVDLETFNLAIAP